MFPIIILLAFLLFFYAPNFKIALKLGNKEITFEIENVSSSNQSESEITTSS